MQLRLVTLQDLTPQELAAQLRRVAQKLDGSGICTGTIDGPGPQYVPLLKVDVAANGGHLPEDRRGPLPASVKASVLRSLCDASDRLRGLNEINRAIAVDSTVAILKELT